MKPNQRAKKIAAILYDTAGGEAIQVHTSLQHIGDLIKKDAQLKSLFQSKRIPNDKKIQTSQNEFPMTKKSKLFVKCSRIFFMFWLLNFLA